MPWLHQCHPKHTSSQGPHVTKATAMSRLAPRLVDRKDGMSDGTDDPLPLIGIQHGALVSMKRSIGLCYHAASPHNSVSKTIGPWEKVLRTPYIVRNGRVNVKASAVDEVSTLYGVKRQTRVKAVLSWVGVHNQFLVQKDPVHVGKGVLFSSMLLLFRTTNAPG